MTCTFELYTIYIPFLYILWSGNPFVLRRRDFRRLKLHVLRISLYFNASLDVQRLSDDHRNVDVIPIFLFPSTAISIAEALDYSILLLLRWSFPRDSQFFEMRNRALMILEVTNTVKVCGSCWSEQSRKIPSKIPVSLLHDTLTGLTFIEAYTWAVFEANEIYIYSCPRIFSSFYK